MLFRLKKPLSIIDLSEDVLSFQTSLNKTALREIVPIAIVDDRDFPALNNLQHNNFNIRYFQDVSSIDVLKDYAIILCDLQGVGTQLNENLQGAHLIKEIKRNYPEKVAIAYTGGTSNSAIARQAGQFADRFLKKDADIDEWLEVLDDFILEVINPVIVWKKFRMRLMDYDISPWQLLELEDAYVCEYRKGGKYSTLAIDKAIASLELKGKAQPVVSNFFKSIAFKLILQIAEKQLQQ